MTKSEHQKRTTAKLGPHGLDRKDDFGIYLLAPHAGELGGLKLSS